MPHCPNAAGSVCAFVRPHISTSTKADVSIATLQVTCLASRPLEWADCPSGGLPSGETAYDATAHTRAFSPLSANRCAADDGGLEGL